MKQLFFRKIKLLLNHYYFFHGLFIFFKITTNCIACSIDLAYLFIKQTKKKEKKEIQIYIIFNLDITFENTTF